MDDSGATKQMQASDRTMVSTASGAQATLMGSPVKCPICGTENAPVEKYCGECGFLLSSTPAESAPASSAQEQARLVDSTGQREYYLQPGGNTVGRENVDILLSDATVSRRHALLTFEEGKCWVEDLGSTNGTYVGANPVRQGEKVELTDGMQVKFGSVVLSLKLPSSPALEVTEEAPTPAVSPEASDQSDQSDADTASTVTVPEAEIASAETAAEPEAEGEPPPAEPSAEPEAVSAEPVGEPEAEPTPPAEETEPAIGRLTYAADPSREFRIMPGTNTIGRRSENDVVLTGDPYVSGTHAQIVADQLGVWLIDLGSTNGTVLNGSKIAPDTRMALSGHDEITFGQTAVKFKAGA